MQQGTLFACALLVLLALSSLPPCTAAEAVCDPTAFAPFQGMSGTVERCSSCLFPTYPYASSINVTAHPPMDFSDTWVYFLGDVSVRQIYGEFAAIVHNAQLGKAVGPPLHHSQHDCVNQSRLLGYVPPPHDRTPCFLNERSCSRRFARTAMGANVTLTYDWKHLMYEDYDRALFNSWAGEAGVAGPDYVLVSPGAHDCFHEPEDWKHHVLQLQKLAKHLHQLNQTVIWVDINPMTYAVHGAPALKCALNINAAAHEQAGKLGFYMFSRQSMIQSAGQLDDNGHYPMHQPDVVVREEVELMLAWLSCMEGTGKKE